MIVRFTCVYLLTLNIVSVLVKIYAVYVKSATNCYTHGDLGVLNEMSGDSSGSDQETVTNYLRPKPKKFLSKY